MRKSYQMIIGALVGGYIVACSPVKFTKELPACDAGCVGVTPTSQSYNYPINASSGAVDIIFVNDNSASMSFEQNQMATRFTSFINALDNYYSPGVGLDYKIGVITTDVSSASNVARAINQNGALQDGRLIQFSNGLNYITPSTTNKTTLFSQVIQRPETLSCEAFLNSNPNPTDTAYKNACPSPDERGILAANMFLRNNSSSFIRSNAHLAIIFLSDEDIRSRPYIYTTIAGYQLAVDDLPQSLISTVNSMYPGKALGVHSIIVRPGNFVGGATATQIADLVGAGSDPTSSFSGGDTACLSTQNSQTNNVLGHYGYNYAIATRLTGGIEGNVCAADYSAQLASIGSSIGTNVNNVQIHCANPTSFTITDNATVPVAISTTLWNRSGNTVTFTPPLTVGNVVRLVYTCPVN